MKNSNLSQINSIKEIKEGLYVYNYPLLKNFQESFRPASLKEIYNTVTEKNLVNSNIRADFYRDGESQNSTLTEINKEDLKKNIEELDKLNLSMRVTNFQFIDSDIRKITTILSKEIDFPVTCNMYITPSSEGNCFKYHIDEQYSVITQLAGSKNWLFPLNKDDSYLKKLDTHDVRDVDDTSRDCLLLQAGDILAIGPNIVHKAQLEGNEMSVHLTFAVSKKNAFNVAKYLIETIKNELLKKDFHIKSVDSVLDLENVKEILIENLSNIDCKDELKKIKKAELILELSTLKKGRPY
jgi:hypothetical protein